MKRVVLLFVLCLPAVLFAQMPWKSKNALLEDARNSVINEQSTKAIELYAELVNRNESSNRIDGDLLLEYAYALALSHNFDFSLTILDQARLLKPKYADFFTRQILEVMGIHKLASSFPFLEAPLWLIADYKTLRSSYGITYSIETSIARNELGRAYELLSQKQYIRSIVILYELEQAYPEAYPIPLVNSYAWECIGNTDLAALYLEKAIQMIGNKEGVDKKEVYVQHLNDLRNKGKHQTSGLIKKYNPRLITYIGAGGANGMFSLNGRVGVYTNSHFSTSLNLSMTRANEQFIGNIGVSAYKTWHFFVAGLGVGYQIGGENKTFSLTPSAGLTFLSKSGASSLDIMFNGFVPFSSNGKFSYGITIGKTFYL